MKIQNMDPEKESSCEKCTLELFELDKIIADDCGIHFLEVHSVIKCPTCTTCLQTCNKTKRGESTVWTCGRQVLNEDGSLKKCRF